MIFLYLWFIVYDHWCVFENLPFLNQATSRAFGLNTVHSSIVSCFNSLVRLCSLHFFFVLSIIKPAKRLRICQKLTDFFTVILMYLSFVVT